MSGRIKKPWPTKDAMHQIYDLHLWGGKGIDFYSGEGSHNPKIVTPYLEAVSSFLKSHNPPMVVCDLGCGDFNIGKHIVSYSKQYIAIDIVERLIERNNTLFKANNLEFHCLDVSKDSIPLGDCAILRQVLQHLSNQEVKSIVNKLSNFKYLILTEHLPNGDFKPNKDIISGQGIRLKQRSGVNVLKAPFNLKIKEQRTLHETILEHDKGRILTMLYTIY